MAIDCPITQATFSKMGEDFARIFGHQLNTRLNESDVFDDDWEDEDDYEEVEEALNFEDESDDWYDEDTTWTEEEPD